MSPTFEVFRRQMLRDVERPTVTVTIRGRLSLNKAALAILGEPAAVELLYDRTDRIIGVRPAADPDGMTAHRLHRTHSGSTAYVYTKAFFWYFGIGLEDARRWPAEPQEGMLCVDVSRPGTPVTSNRRKLTK